MQKQISTDVQHVINELKQLSSAQYMDRPVKQQDVRIAHHGLSLSKSVNRLPELLAMTPWMRNSLEKLDNIVKDRNPLLISNGVTKAEKYWVSFQDTLLRKYNGPPNVKYPVKDVASYLSRQMYDIDCHRNRLDSFRQVPTDLLEQVEEKTMRFVTKAPFSKLLSRIKADPNLFTAIAFVIKQMPDTGFSNEWVDIAGPYMTKHTNVGAPYFRNDKAIDKPTGKTYAQLALLDAQKAEHDVYSIPRVAVLLNRAQNQKGRNVFGTSRSANIYFNRVLGPTIDIYKRSCPFMKTYLSNDEIMVEMTKTANFAQKYDLLFDNRDYTQFDSTIPVDLKALAFAMLITKTSNPQAKEIWREGFAFFSRHMLADGIAGKVRVIHGRMISGEIFTNFVENVMNAVMVAYACISLLGNTWITMMDKALSSGITPWYMMGDDNGVLVTRGLDYSKYNELILRTFGVKLHPLEEKGEPGFFMLQNRLYKRGREMSFVTPWPRVLNSLLFRERPVGLGPRGWDIFMYQALDRLKREPEIRDEFIREFGKWDNQKLGSAISLRQFLDELRKEDQMAQQEGKIETAVKLWTGNPNTQHQFESGGEFSRSFIAEMHDMISRVLR
uniref:Putative replicase n=1 Tax=Sitsystermes virus TaxID=2796632 RepID=A0A7T7GV11_9VIRU|nr:putative replicase [Sitsystermes virus]